MTDRKNPTLIEQQQMRDELFRAKLVATTLDSVLSLLDTPKTFEIDVICPRCGSQSIRHTRDAKAPGYVTEVCADCAAGDRPEDRYDSGVY